MIKLDVGNVLLKPSHRRQLMAWLRRALRLGDRLGDRAISITLHRMGRLVEMRADVRHRGDVVAFRSREHDWRHAAREMVRALTQYLHDQSLHAMPG